MTPQEALNHFEEHVCKHCCEWDKSLRHCNTCPTDIAKKALEKADKYRWHDLRKNPDDLPVKAEYVEVITDEHDDTPLSIQYDDAIMQFGERRISLGYVDSVFIEWDAERRGEIIAWRYIEPFKEEK